MIDLGTLGGNVSFVSFPTGLNDRGEVVGYSLAMLVRDENSSSDIWTLEVARGIPTRKTFDPSTDWFPVWTPDGSRLIFGSTRDGATTMCVKRATGSAQNRVSSINRRLGAPEPIRAMSLLTDVSCCSTSRRRVAATSTRSH